MDASLIPSVDLNTPRLTPIFFRISHLHRLSRLEDRVGGDCVDDLTAVSIELPLQFVLSKVLFLNETRE